jgi:dihydropteroate synthase
MGILNVTPDSFSDGGRYFAADAAVSHALEMQAQGAEIIDVGGQSTRPGAERISAQEEILRLEPVLEGLRGVINAHISVDTFYTEAAEFALENGAVIVNDVSGTPGAAMAETVLRHSAGWIIMHNPGGQGGAVSVPDYPNGVVRAVRDFFVNSLTLAENWGIPANSLCLDPGFGFGKTYAEHAALLSSRSIWDVGAATLIGLSRKRFVRELFGAQTEPELDIAGAALHSIAAKNGAKIIRTHNVALTKQVLKSLC